MRLLLATSNARKVEGFTRVLGRHGIHFETVPYDEPEPQAETVEEVSRWKAIYAFRRHGRPVLVTDFGAHFHALGGFPGPGLKLVHKQLGLDGMLKVLRKLDGAWREIVGHESHVCSFAMAIGYMDRRLKEPRVFGRRIPGVIDPSLYGRLGLDRDAWLDRLFVPDDAGGIAIGQMSPRMFEAWRSSPANERVYVDLVKWLRRARPALRRRPT
jgi:inosine/xanthosine triphosphate pyrophosphatase family protein